VSICRHLQGCRQRLHLDSNLLAFRRENCTGWGEGMNTADKPPEDVAQELEVPERLPEEIDPDILRKYFTLTESDLEQVEQCRGPINRLGFAVQLCTLR
jgi:hypothetical protein